MMMCGRNQGEYHSPLPDAPENGLVGADDIRPGTR